MSNDPQLESRVAALETTVQEMRKLIAELRAALTIKPAPSGLRSAGMLDRPKSGR